MTGGFAVFSNKRLGGGNQRRKMPDQAGPGEGAFRSEQDKVAAEPLEQFIVFVKGQFQRDVRKAHAQSPSDAFAVSRVKL